jgi:hypothetical protein
VTLILVRRVVVWWLCTAQKNVSGGWRGGEGEWDAQRPKGRVDVYHPFVGVRWVEACLLLG